ncbi:hypothetical protein H340_10795 [Streptomyces mobaraensis NBRC 13819 = DSM 40847]|uniref:Uncharacterized protein n=1 Tax=Streptomyces mobaraensis (strain ATCC 29032 / DSM 40847 / JCM 4168 / NBRC 13819 / NCIMB 11159 / IPCR 16-22) TaxID=1223523 RepID=M3C940_STRM1|nr:hypothetical protein H340_10795 [Streptomyces mobaraensis NBRC 13819 = DSM 40847]
MQMLRVELLDMRFDRFRHCATIGGEEAVERYVGIAATGIHVAGEAAERSGHITVVVFVHIWPVDADQVQREGQLAR